MWARNTLRRSPFLHPQPECATAFKIFFFCNALAEIRPTCSPNVRVLSSVTPRNLGFGSNRAIWPLMVILGCQVLSVLPSEKRDDSLFDPFRVSFHSLLQFTTISTASWDLVSISCVVRPEARRETSSAYRAGTRLSGRIFANSLI